MSNDLKTFIALSITERISKKKICFQGAVYPLLFFTSYFSQIKKQGISVQALDLEEQDFKNVVCQLEMAILGNTYIYWLKNLSNISPALQKQYISYVLTYKGPHQIYFFSQEAILSDDIYTIILPEEITESDYRTLSLFFEYDLTLADQFITTLFARHTTVSFENALLLIRYQTFLGRRFQPFMQEWLPRLITAEQSLFTMSQFFFARQYAQFLREWRYNRAQYPDEFWVVFWSEQLWQALIFIEHVCRGQLAEARRKVFRLPFSFMNKDWKLYTEKELNKAHQFLYAVDYGIKNGHATDGVDLFVHKFLLSQFK